MYADTSIVLVGLQKANLITTLIEYMGRLFKAATRHREHLQETCHKQAFGELTNKCLEELCCIAKKARRIRAGKIVRRIDNDVVMIQGSCVL